MDYSQDGFTLTKQFEGCKLVSYRDQGGVLTIGYGHTKGVTAGMTCTKAQADSWLNQDIQFAVNFVNLHVKVSLTQGQFDACVDFTFNLGVSNFGSSTLLKLLNAGNYAMAELEFVKWIKCAEINNPGLLRRRIAETLMFRGK